MYAYRHLILFFIPMDICNKKIYIDLMMVSLIWRNKDNSVNLLSKEGLFQRFTVLTSSVKLIKQLQ